ncbi:anthranilate phosphoribosyltransferase [Methanopyrus kandleri]|uniref:Anthranilate phosphoribosyltransferase n=2 Tax=Methanopyrus kandleri TaxID=2320 RepID=TRPD_METKA|nr:anthranilate phosphoribosyltransferase [Methanopyrus kandleri]Q8TXJ5.1 RecName: Full=Anthranilate phosphoribosyltransferase [Methanopyrus kandleri AV19]AAM01893.1 Anthranilate phosphoribosyltransferase [Methanopyrus kandleri AV19]HII70097.1 anthranilate phosphoribosyltransferase [Methanopyrus kandleri]
MSVLERIIRGSDLDREEARDLMCRIVGGELSDVEVAGILVALRCKGYTSEELVGFVDGMMEHAVKVDPDVERLVDTAGTGGDELDTFNASTLAGLTAAAAGVPVAKHGNRSVTSECGSADILEALGVNIEADPDTVKRCIEEVGFGFMFAPKFHPAMKNVMPVRRKLGIRTVFNVLGPLTNPARERVTGQVIGVYSENLLDLVAGALAELGVRRGLVVYGLDGVDELSVTCENEVVYVDDGEVTDRDTVAPEDVGLDRADPKDVAGADPETSAEEARKILGGELPVDHPKVQMTAFNAGAALYVGEAVDSLEKGIQRALDVLEEGRALEVLEKVVDLSS